jgi:hypothetical protein
MRLSHNVRRNIIREEEQEGKYSNNNNNSNNDQINMGRGNLNGGSNMAIVGAAALMMVGNN